MALRHIFLGLAAWLALAPALAAPDRQDIAALAAAEIESLQRRLTDAGCFTGAADGKPSESLRQAVAQCPDQRPKLVIETGMHVAKINRLGVNAACTLAATGSDDKTVRLWSLPEGKLLRTLRGPIGNALHGSIYSVAMSPDGRFIAAGGYDAFVEVGNSASLLIFDAQNGAVAARIGKFEGVIDHIAFSQDGRWLAAVLGAGKGVRMIDASTWREVAADRAYSGNANGVAFGPDNRLYTVANDGRIRRYGRGPDFLKEAEATTRDGKEPFSVTVDPKGERLAVGLNDSLAVTFYAASNLAYLGKAQASSGDPDRDGAVSTLAWLGGGQILAAGGTLRKAERNPVQFYYRDGAPAPLPTFTSPADTVLSMQPCGPGVAIASGDPAFGLLDGQGAPLLWRRGVTIDMRNKAGFGFAVSRDGKGVRFGLGNGDASPVVFNLAAGNLADGAKSPPDFDPPDQKSLPVSAWADNAHPKFAGKPIALDKFETSRAVAVRADRAGFALGTDYRLRAYDSKGALLWAKLGPGPAWGVNLAQDGKLILAAYGDGTIRWLRWSDGAELLALFVNRDTKAWVAWTPAGYYMASPGGEDLIGWHVNRGWAQAADFFPAARFRDVYSRPDIVSRVLDTLDESEAIRLANLARPNKAAPAPITENLPPLVSILSPADGAMAEGEVTIDYLIRSPSNLAVEAVEAVIDGRPAGAARGLQPVTETQACLALTQGQGRREGALQGCRGALTLTLPPGAHEVGIFARAGSRTSEVATLRLTRKAPAAAEELLKPKLYALVVGVADYADANYRLGYPAKDAQDFARALEHQKGGLYGDVTVRLIVDRAANASAIRDGLDWLSKQVTSRDVGMVYLAGHGVLDERERFYFLASDSDAKRLRATAVPKDDIQDALDALAGKALLFLDACHAAAVSGGQKRGAIDINAIVNDFSRAERGVVVFAASTGRQTSQENVQWRNGAFTKALVEGLGSPGEKARADLRGDGRITMSLLDAYVADRVKELTGGEQSPVMIRPNTVPDYPLALAR